MYNFEFVLEGDSLKLDLSVDNSKMLLYEDDAEPKKNAEPKKDAKGKKNAKPEIDPQSVYKTFAKTELLKDKPYPVNKSLDLELNLKDSNFILSGEGNLYMVMLVPKDEEGDITKFRNTGKIEDIPNIFKRITCDNNKFNFLKEVPIDNILNIAEVQKPNILV